MIAFRGIDFNDQPALAKWDLLVESDREKGGTWLTYVQSGSFMGPSAPVRLYFDGSPNYAEISVPVRTGVALLMDSKLRDRFAASREVKGLHGVTSREIAFRYDVTEFRRAINLMQTLCS